MNKQAKKSENIYTQNKDDKVNLKNRSSRPEVICKEGALKNFAKLTGKRLQWSLFLNKVSDWSLATLFNRDSG